MTTSTILDMQAFQEAKDMMKAKFPIMLQYFLEDTETYIASIHEGLALVNASKIVSPAHTIKSSSKQMGAIAMSEIAKAMEMLAREQSDRNRNDMPPFVEMLSQLEAAFAETKAAFEQQNI